MGKFLKFYLNCRFFSRKYFYADVTDPLHYDLVINTARMSIDAAVKSIIAALHELNAG